MPFTKNWMRPFLNIILNQCPLLVFILIRAQLHSLSKVTLFTVCVWLSWCICVALTRCQLEGLWLSGHIFEVGDWAHTPAQHTKRRACDWPVCPRGAVTGWAGILSRSQINHCALEQLGLGVNCGGDDLFELNIVKYAFLCHFENITKKKKDCNVRSIYSCLCITGESRVQMYFVYTMLYITEVHSFSLVQYCTVIAIVV